MNASNTAACRESVSPATENLRVADPPDYNERAEPDSISAEPGSFEWYSEVLDFTNGLLKECRETSIPKDIYELAGAATKACMRLLESEDAEEVRWGMRYYIRLYQLRLDHFRLSSDVANTVLNHAGRIGVAYWQGPSQGAPLRQS